MAEKNGSVQRLRAIIEVKDREIENLKIQLRFARRDELTGLPKRLELIEETQHLLNQKYPVSLIFMDLNGFKEINDEIGHVAGDSLLIQFGEFLRKQRNVLGENGQLATLARLGGDEFAILLPYTDNEEARGFAEIIRRNLQDEIFPVGEHHLFVLRAAIGIGTADADCPTASTLMHRADRSMYEDKFRMKEIGDVTKKMSRG